MPSRGEIVARALGYPFPRPSSSVLIADGRVRELDRLDARGRTPVLAYGSNASPASLGWKFPEERDAVLPLVRGTLGDLDVVYSSHIAVYGSVPATLAPSPGTRVETFVAFLTADQLELVAGWEINATYETLAVDLDLDVGDAVAQVGAFVSRHGALAVDGRAVAVAEVPAVGRTLSALRQPEVLEHVRAAVAPELTLEDFVVGNVEDYDRARGYTARLPGIPFEPSRRGDSNP